MKIWRICKQQHANTALSGIGAELYGGRWNSAGRRMVYCASSLSLAALETFVHIEVNLLPTDLVSVEVHLPEECSREMIRVESLPEDWRTYPAPEQLQEIGNQWLINNSSVVLIVPSVVIPAEENYLLNPLHIDFQRIRISEIRPFTFDPRMFRS